MLQAIEAFQGEVRDTRCVKAYPVCAHYFVELYDVDRSGPCVRHHYFAKFESNRGCVQNFRDLRPFRKMSRYLHKGLALGMQNYVHSIWWVHYLDCRQKTHGDICHFRTFQTEH